MKSRSSKKLRRERAAEQREQSAVGDTSLETTTYGTRSRGWPSWKTVVAAVLLLAVFAAQALVAARRDSVTIDEFGHLPMGLYIQQTGDLSVDPVNTQGPRLLAALALAGDPPLFAPPPDAGAWGLGYYFMEANAADYQSIFVRARSATVLLALLAAIAMAVWTLEMYGSAAALIALTLFAFSPSLLAHGHLVTQDMAGALGFVMALYANWRFLRAPSWQRALVLGLALGAANLLKLSGFVLVAMVLVTWAIRLVSQRRAPPSLAQWGGLLLVCGVTAMFTLNLGYAFDGTFGLLGEAALAPGGKLATLAREVPWLRLPLPRPFLEGLDMAMEVGKEHEPSYFLAGELSSEGWWYYHLAAFAGKCPLPVLLAGFFAFGAWVVALLDLRRRGGPPASGTYEYAVFVPIALLFAANALFNSLAIGERHVLAVYPLLFVGISPWLARGLAGVPTLAGFWRSRRGGLAALAAATSVAALLWTAAGTLAIAPRYLQFFNEAVGGEARGHRYLIDSNIDWGQDLIRLREYMDQNQLDTIGLAYFGRVHPAVYGIGFTPLERGTTHGKVAVSATFLMGRPYFWYQGGRMRWVHANTYAWLQGYKPVARVGAMFVFDLP